MEEIYEGLRTVIPLYFPHTSHRECTLLYRRDISVSNILVDSKDNLVSMVDWECVAAVPVWQGCGLPQLLHGRPYTFTQMPPAPTDDFDVEDHKYYKKNLMSYELAQLRAFFLEEMQRISPDWMEVFRRERLRYDILLAVEKSGNDGTVKWVKAWLKALMQGAELETSLKDGCRSAYARQNAKWIWA
ncbi:transferase [Ascochyta rabiei]|uniref:Transferase n=1 Tax=Didymella rabiei TaxID=5454 RepID=A0A163BIA4_DIDRA|nr:transferase [Ascochyta rabiei]